LYEAIVDRRVVPVLGDLLVALSVLQRAIVGKMNSIKGSQDFMGC
jgi:hypothetical protein